MAKGTRGNVVRLGRPRAQARGIATRRKVLAAAEALFTRRGSEPTGMADVAERAGVGTLYHHFPDKRALLLALIDDWGDRELARAERNDLRATATCARGSTASTRSASSACAICSRSAGAAA